MDMSQESDDLLQMFTGPQPKKSRTNTPRAEKGATGSLRVEKGTHKVNTHEVAEQASTLLYMCLKMADIKDEAEQQKLLQHITKEVEKVVLDFGLDKDRIKAEAEKRAIQEARKLTQRKDIADLRSQYAALGEKLEAIERILDAEAEISPFSYQYGLPEARTTRQGLSRKRDREVEELDQNLNKMKAVTKRMKVAEDNYRRRSS